MPQYISTVDSGNLAGHLIAVKQACIEFPDMSLFDHRVIEGLTDTVDAIAIGSGESGQLSTTNRRRDCKAVAGRDRCLPATVEG